MRRNVCAVYFLVVTYFGITERLCPKVVAVGVSSAIGK